MVFSSAVFLFIFLPIVFILNLILPKGARNYLLLFASLLFYAWGEPVFVLIMILSISLNYALARGISTANSANYKKLFIILSVVINLSLLGVFKYAGFFVENLNAIAGLSIAVPKIRLPIGISFFTFQAMSYCIDVYRNRTGAQKNIFKVALYISFFPQLIAGPIVKYHDIAEQIDSRQIDVDKVAYGIKRFVFGLSKKLLLANTMGLIADEVFAISGVNASIAWIGSICYTLQIFFDFSGYSDMAIGLGSMFGFKFKENFDYPFVSKGIQEFWRRWHISLGAWFREYLYIPLGGNRKGILRTSINYGIVFFFTGLWHGAQWTFVIWGLWHGFFLILENLKVINIKKLPKVLSHIYTLLIVIIGFTMFRAQNIEQGMEFIRMMFTGFVDGGENLIVLRSILSPSVIVTFAFALIASVPFVRDFGRKMNNQKLAQSISYSVVFVLLILCVFSLSSSTFNPFIYFRF